MGDDFHLVAVGSVLGDISVNGTKPAQLTASG
jgi:hypothetical protein